jgi:hypothetical protein
MVDNQDLLKKGKLENILISGFRINLKDHLFISDTLKKLTLSNTRARYPIDEYQYMLTKKYHDFFTSFTFLKILKLDYHYIGEIKKGFFSTLGHLEQLELTNCSIESIEGDSFVGMNMLSDLVIRDNSLKRIESNTFNGLNNLKVLKVDLLEIGSIEKTAFRCLINLKELCISHCIIKLLDEDCLNELRELNLIENNQNHTIRGKKRALDED